MSLHNERELCESEELLKQPVIGMAPEWLLSASRMVSQWKRSIRTYKTAGFANFLGLLCLGVRYGSHLVNLAVGIMPREQLIGSALTTRGA